MDADQEFHFLTELSFLGDAADWHAAAVRALANSWTTADAQVRKVDPVLHTRDELRARRSSSKDRLARLSAGMARKGDAQFELFARVDAFLAIYGRISLILFPQGEGHGGAKAARAVHLRGLLGIAPPHPVADKQFRNKWFHVDELLDSMTEWRAKSSTPQLFTSLDRATEMQRAFAARLFIVDTLTVSFAGVGKFELAAMFDAAEDVYIRVQAARDSWSDRWEVDNASQGP